MKLLLLFFILITSCDRVYADNNKPKPKPKHIKQVSAKAILPKVPGLPKMVLVHVLPPLV